MFFSLLPNIEYAEKPIGYPFSESDFVIAKNFFRRFKIRDDGFSYSVYFTKYAITDTDRPDSLAKRAYGDPFFDWVILLTNNMVNVNYDWPLNNSEIEKTLSNEYDNPYTEIHHYETTKIGQFAAGLRVDEAFYNAQHKVNENGVISLKNGSEICGPVTVAEHFFRENDKKREIYLLKPRYFESFVNQFRKANRYKKSSNYISQKLKKTG